MWPKVGNQTDVSRKNLWLKHIGHRNFRKQIAALTKCFKDEHSHLLCFSAAGARSLHSIFRKLVQRAVRCLLARLKKCHLRNGEKQIRHIRGERKNESYFLAATGRDQVAVPLIIQESQVYADSIKRKIERDAFGIQNAKPLFSFRSAILRSILKQVGRSFYFFRLY